MININFNNKTIRILKSGCEIDIAKNYLLIIENQYSKVVFVFKIIGADICASCGLYSFDIETHECMSEGYYDYYFVEDNGFDLSKLDINNIPDSTDVANAGIISLNCKPLYFDGKLMLTSDEHERNAVLELKVLNRGLLYYCKEQPSVSKIINSKGFSDNLNKGYGA